MRNVVATLGKMYVTSRISNIALLGLLVSLYSLSDRGFGTAETIVDTDSHVVLEVGTRGILPCRVRTKAYSVEWKRQLSSETELLVLLDTYVYVGARDGPGYEAGLFNITDDYSLVIKDVKVQDEGIYICSVSDFNSGKFFRNSTRVSVQAFPDEPFPVIQECIGKDVNPGVCTLVVHATSNLTCLVKGYYPDIDLFFLHGSEKVTSAANEEWENADGTKNKEITVQIRVSDEPYECVASRAPVIGGNRSVSVIVKAHSQGPNTAAIVVTVTMVVLGGLAIAVICKHRLGKSKGRRSTRGFEVAPSETPVEGWCSGTDIILAPGGTQLKVPNGPISKNELWKLITTAKKNDVSRKLEDVVRLLRKHMSITDIFTMQDLYLFESLCTWKTTSSKSNQRMNLYTLCCEGGMTDIITTMIDYAMDTSHEVSSANIENILWEIDTSKIIELLKTFGLDHGADAKASAMRRNDVIDLARKELLKWRNREFNINPLVILSLKLEDLQCDTHFFKRPISKLELWKLMRNAKENGALMKLSEALRRLLNKDTFTWQDDDDFYQSLCMWKSEKSSNPYHRKELYSVCWKAGMTDITLELIDFFMDTSPKDFSDNIEHILLQIDAGKITELFKAFGLNHEAVAEARERGSAVTEVARQELMKWRDRDFDINPLVVLSLKLDDLQSKTNFFIIFEE